MSAWLSKRVCVCPYMRDLSASVIGPTINPSRLSFNQRMSHMTSYHCSTTNGIRMVYCDHNPTSDGIPDGRK
ncbi:uncharacterized protein EURHEDRAFT_415169 [Aspergillus ruber CBS 135680]|uniref:Uncharacterized protein n=1 Tax=Aspergillus ruber (strain CBS 135680) TaxID=1388766 RepID=A0A017S7F1_ASPRC|nr:uncharacterized protein EURHEDRAFT_415169 [Aspergillus ruber CBS 135680]EYE92786.1 hypothetical protein EURHEDRAFT_415169 [Aspergillus ruber CBS 135680]